MHIDYRNGAPSSSIKVESLTTSNSHEGGDLKAKKNIHNIIHGVDQADKSSTLNNESGSSNVQSSSTTTSSTCDHQHDMNQTLGKNGKKNKNKNKNNKNDKSSSTSVSSGLADGITTHNVKGSSKSTGLAEGSASKSTSMAEGSSKSTGTLNGTTVHNIASNDYTVGSSTNSASYNDNHKEPCEQTQQNINSFLSHDGQADTTVHETIKPAVVNEHITSTQHDENQRIIDREIHQDHHHTTVQPIRDQAFIPASHSHAVAGTETREFQHGNDQRIHQALENERAQFRNTTDASGQLHTTSTSKTVAGEHVHHHVHENIQPVVERDVHQAHVLHTTHPVHEIHHNESLHHTASSLPEINLADFKKQGGKLDGTTCRTDTFQGAPKAVDERVNAQHSTVLGGPGAKGTTSVTGNLNKSGSNSNATTINWSANNTECSSGHNSSSMTGNSSTSGQHYSSSSNSSGLLGTGSDFHHSCGGSCGVAGQLGVGATSTCDCKTTGVTEKKSGSPAKNKEKKSGSPAKNKAKK